MQGYLRNATEEDMELLFRWANEPSVRQNSFSTAEITWEEHVLWFERLLKRDDCRQYIYMYAVKPVGQVRVTVTDEGAEIGYSICAEMRGMGYGKDMLKLLVHRVKEDLPQVNKLVAKVKPQNVASHKVFLSSGYQEKCRVYEMDIK